MNRTLVLVSHRFTRQGGMERALLELALRLDARGWEIVLVTRRGAERVLGDRARYVEMALPERPYLLMFPFFYILAGLRVAQLRRQGAIVHAIGSLIPNRLDVVTVQFVHRAFNQLAGAGTSGRRHGRAWSLYGTIARGLSELTERYSYRSARIGTVVAVSRGIEREIEAAYPDLSARVEVIPNGVDRNVFRPDSDGRAAVRGEIGLDGNVSVAVFVGGDWRRKGLMYAIDALGAVPAWHLLVVGDGALDEARAAAEAAGATGRVHFVGQQARPERYMAAADVFVLPTAYEAFPLVVLEAAASGLPLLVTRVNGTEELVEPGANGVFIERDAATIAAALGELTDHDLRAQMGAQARAATEPYDWDRIAEAYESTYRAMSRAAKPTAADLLEREREFHDRLAGQIDPHDETPHDPDPLEKGLLERLGDVRGLRVLDLGCGSGELSATLLARGAAVTGIDLSPGMVAVARKRAEARGLAEHAIFVAAPAHELPFDDSAFDIVVGKWILHHLDGEAETTEIRRVLKPGGRALFAENSGANPVLRIARERLAGRFGIPRFGTEDEHPLEDADLETYRRCFAHVEVMYPSFHFWQLLDRQALRYRWSRPSRALRALDDATWRYVPAARRFSFHMLIEIS